MTLRTDPASNRVPKPRGKVLQPCPTASGSSSTGPTSAYAARLWELREVYESGPDPAPPPSLYAQLSQSFWPPDAQSASDFPFVISSSGALIFCHFGRRIETKRSGAVA